MNYKLLLYTVTIIGFAPALVFPVPEGQRLHQASLPGPYQSLQYLLPFDPQGWGINDEPIAALFAKNPRICTVVEIGSWLGRSTRYFASLLQGRGKVYAVDHWNGSEEHQPGGSAYLPVLPRLYEQFLSNVIHSGLTQTIVPVRMDSVDAAKTLDVSPDLVYIDGAHDTESVLADLRAWFPLVRGRGILCGDDLSWPSVAAAVHLFADENNLTIELASNGNFWRYYEK